MRITQVLFRGFNKYRFYKNQWKNRQSLKNVEDLGIPQALVEKNIPVYDAVKFVAEEPAELSKFFPPKEDRRQPHWAYFFNHKTKFLEGPHQAQIFSNAIVHTKLPEEYVEAFNAMSLPEDEVKWFHNRMEINALDCFQFKLRLKIDPERPWHRFKRDFAPGIGRDTLEFTSTLNDFVRLHANPANLTAYKPLVHELCCQYMGSPKRNADGSPGVNPYIFQGYVPSAAVTRKPLAVLPSSASSKESGPTGRLPSIYPTLPEVDAAKKFDYEPRTIPATNVSPSTGLSLHTLFVSHPWNDDSWKLTDKVARAVLQSFTFAAAETVSRLGVTGGDLPVEERLRIQTVYHDLETVGFIVFQLNTLNPASFDYGEGPLRNEFFHECFPIRENEGLNPTALKWLKVFYET